VTITLAPGEVLALLGKNDAGKTTLMNILFGHYMPDAGTVTVGRQALRLSIPHNAIAADVGIIHQHFTLTPNLTVLENVMTKTEPLVSLRSGRAAARAKLANLADRFNLAVNPDAHVSALSVSQQQRVEILKALYNNARILILDKPTAVLTRPEAEHLFATLRDMAQQELSIIFISHKLHEVMARADKVVVLRGEHVTAKQKTNATSQTKLAKLMVGRRVERPVRQANPVGPLLIEARNADVPMPGSTPLRSVDFNLRGTEILGIIGVSGNGQTTLAHLLSGLASPSNGEVLILDQDARALSAAKIAALGVGRIPEDRNTEGAVGSFPLWQNAVLERLSDVRFSQFGVVRRGAARRFCADIATRFDLRGGGPETETRQLSGGNMQKLILGRNLADAPRINMLKAALI